jgi:hypothetical protein
MSIELAQWLLGFMGCRMTFFRPFGGTPPTFFGTPRYMPVDLQVAAYVSSLVSTLSPVVAGVWGWPGVYFRRFFFLKSIPPTFFILLLT